MPISNWSAHAILEKKKVTKMGKVYRVRCKELDAEGRGVVEFNHRKFSIKGLLPGELATMKLVFKKTETTAELCEVLEPSKDRVTPTCAVYGTCGGCQLLHLSAEQQAKWKFERCEKLFREYGTPLPILSAEHPTGYRNKVHASFAATYKNGRRSIVSGIFEEDSHKVAATKDCLLQDRRAAAYLKTIRSLMEETGTLPYREDTKQGTLRYAFFRFGEESGEVLLALVTGTPEFAARDQFAKVIRKKHPEIKTLIHNVNQAKTSMVLGRKETVLYGDGYIEDTLLGCTFRISDASFYQINSEQTKVLYQVALSYANLQKTDIVLDAYCGIGTISLLAAKQAGRVVGVELNERAVSDAITNCHRNHLQNVTFIKADAGEYMKTAAKNKEHFDVVFLDPPRAGSDEAFLSSLRSLSPERIVYISCNPETQARDLKPLTAGGYRVEKIQPVDMFPGTNHVECVVLLSRQKM